MAVDREALQEEGDQSLTDQVRADIEKRLIRAERAVEQTILGWREKP